MASASLVTTVVLTRHGERTAIPGNQDPPLNAAGKARAKELIHVAGQSGIKAIYCSHFIRSLQTAKPLAAHLDLPPIVMDDALQIRNDILSNHAGQTVLVIGHSNTVPEIIDRLGAGGVPAIGESEFDNLFVVKVFDQGRASVTRLKYGKQS